MNIDIEKRFEELEKIAQEKKTIDIYRKVDIDSSRAKKVISFLAQKKRKDISSIKEEILKKIEAEEKELEDTRLNRVMKRNLIESILFDALKEFSTEYKFSRKHFNDLFLDIMSRNKSFFDLKDLMTGQKIKMRVILIPSKFESHPKWVTDVKTAAASAEGDLIFNIDFLKQFCMYAKLVNEKPIGKIYVSNGGSIPDEYAYLEFLILHEVYHIVHADHFYGTHGSVSHKTQNIIGDFVTNYNLVKWGYSQPPVGLFSDFYNYDVCVSMKEMQTLIIEDMKNEMPENNLDEHLDSNHNKIDQSDGQNGGQDQSGQDQSGQDQSGQGDQDGDSQGDQNGQGDQSGQDQSGDQDGDSQGDQNGQGDQSGDQDGDSQGDQNGQGDQSGDNQNGEGDQNGEGQGQNGDGQGGQENLEDKIDERMKDSSSKKRDEEKTSSDDNKNSKSSRPSKFGSGKKSPTDRYDIKNIKPIDWAKLLNKMIPHKKLDMEETYKKLHRKTLSSMANNESCFAMKPGVKKIEGDEEFKLLFIIDQSGSMSHLFSAIAENVSNLVKKAKKLNIDKIHFGMFDADFGFYKIDNELSSSKLKVVEIETEKLLKMDPVSVSAKTGKDPKNFDEFMKLNWGGGTDLQTSIVDINKNYLDHGFNTVIFSDSDLLYENNIESLKEMIEKGKKKPFSFNIIMDCKNSYDQMVKALGFYKYASYIEA